MNALSRKVQCILPSVIDVVLSDRLYIAKDQLPQPLLNRIVRLAAFPNPEFYKAQSLRLSVWDKPRIIDCAENFPRHIAMPRGCLHDLENLLLENEVELRIKDERSCGKPIAISFTGLLRPEQEAAVEAMLKHEHGVLNAPTAFGKTVASAALIARRGVNTLVLVHRRELQQQWKERLNTFLTLEAPGVGTIGGGANRPSGIVDIAVLQPLYCGPFGDTDPTRWSRPYNLYAMRSYSLFWSSLSDPGARYGSPALISRMPGYPRGVFHPVFIQSPFTG